MPDLIEPGELRHIARAISAVENQSEGYEQILKQAYRLERWPDIIGITGPPGAGKSTLVDALTAHWASAGERVAVLAIDPSSPYSGGAVLGDRIRRTRSAGLANTYFRSLSSRGHVGGLTETATDLIAVLNSFQFRRVLIETVGAGQADIEIHETADCTLVITVPGLGDGVQASKAGLMEIGDVFAVNKADLPGAEDAAQTIERSLAAAYRGEPGINARNAAIATATARHADTPGVAALRRRHGDVAVDDSTWVPPVARVVATENTGVPELAATVDTFIAWSDETGRRRARTRERAYAQVMRALSALLLAPFVRATGTDQFPASVEPWIRRIAEGTASPREAARALADDVGR
jgi:LAO/AO transport system kinase